ncbi:MAG: hypothetical protein PUD72_03035 [Oscillospiraceae bacterium]|nr:hypothetical protein [Oscillospiraceae bacterium]
MKISTLIKLGALGVAAASTAAGSVLLTTKAVKKLGNETFPDDPNQKGVDINNAPSMDGVSKNEVEQAAQSYQASAAPIIPEAYVAPIPAPVPPAPIAPVPEPIPAPVAPVPEPVIEEKYTDVPMNLPYLAGKLGEDDADAAEIIITPSEQKAQDVVAPAPVVEPVAEPVVAPTPVVEPVAEPVVAPTPVVEPVAEPVVAPIPVVEPVAEPVVAPAPVVEPVAEPVVAPAPVVEPVAEPVVAPAPVVEPVAEPVVAPIPVVQPVEVPTVEAQPEVVLPKAEPITFEETNSKPEGQTFADINPLGQGFSVAMAEEVADPLPPVESTSSAEVLESPVTFDNLTSDYVEEIPPVVETPVAVPVYEAPMSEPVAQPVVEPLPQPVVEPVEDGRTVQIGGAVVSDRKTDSAIATVSSTFDVPVENLVSIAAEGNSPMVFEFLYPDMKTDATLMNVYFILPDGQATLPPETEKESVLAFGRNFITGNEELRAFLA